MDDRAIALPGDGAERGAPAGPAPDVWALAADLDLTEASSLDFECPVAVRVSPDKVHAQVRLAADALNAPLEMLVSLAQEQCSALGVQIPLAESDVSGYLRHCREGEWVTIASGTPAIPPIDGGADVLVALSAGADTAYSRRGRCFVRAHTPLATLRQGRPGTPGRDIYGRTIGVRTLRTGRLPRGENTYVGDDGTTLLASCDGEVVLRQLLIHVEPTRIVDGATLEVGRTVECPGDFFVQGTVGGCAIAAAGDVYVDGHAQGSCITSAGGGVTVSRGVAGERDRHAILRAPSFVACHSALHATLSTAGEVYLHEARYSLVEAGGNIHLGGTIEASLHDVEVRIEGGIICAAPPPPPPTPAPTERQYLRVPTGIRGEAAVGGVLPLRFLPCCLDDLSEGGACCRFSGYDEVALPEAGAFLHLKFALPGRAARIYAIARVVRHIAPRTIGVAFADLMQSDRARIAEYCLEAAGFYPAALLSSAADRKR